MSVFRKTIWSAGILLIFALIAITNTMDRNRFTVIKDAVITIYEDRLIAKDIITKLLHLVYEKEIAIVSSDAEFFKDRNKTVNDKIDELIIKFQGTKLTSAEEIVFAELQTNYNHLQKIENSISFDLENQNASIINQIDEIQKNLAGLSSIQVEEGERQLATSKKAVEEIEIFTLAENAMLILLAILLIIIVFLFPLTSNEK